MTVHLPPVPDSVPLSKLQAFCRSLGVEPKDVIEMRARRGAVQFDVWSRDADGEIFADGDEVAHHTITVPIDDWPAPDDEEAAQARIDLAVRDFAAAAAIDYEDALAIITEARQRFELHEPEVEHVADLMAGGGR